MIMNKIFIIKFSKKTSFKNYYIKKKLKYKMKNQKINNYKRIYNKYKIFLLQKNFN